MAHYMHYTQGVADDEQFPWMMFSFAPNGLCCHRQPPQQQKYRLIDDSVRGYQSVSDVMYVVCLSFFGLK